MKVTELYSKRLKKLNGDTPEIFVYDQIPQPLRIQIVHILKEVLGEDKPTQELPAVIYKDIYKRLCREYGRFSLGSNFSDTYQDRIFNFFLETKKNEEALDVIELLFKTINTGVRLKYEKYKNWTSSCIDPDQAIKELNHRFLENGIGYSFEGDNIVRIDSTFVHSEITKPVLLYLSDKKWEGANEEYLKAHSHYRDGRNKECLTECLKAFESVLKTICTEKGWTSRETDTAKKLIQICFTNNLVPSFSQNQFTSLQNLLESGIPPLRNKLGGHGQGQKILEVDGAITRYALNLTGSSIIFLIEQSGLDSLNNE